ncbi:MAG: YceH family protein [Actinomycetota bacterium]
MDGDELPELDPLGARVLGCLVEKERLTPQAYPLTLNALVAACNQSTGRDPVLSVDEHEVLETLGRLRAESLTRVVHPRSGRGVTKYRQVLDEVFRLEADGMAVLCLLLLRGDQTVGELRARTERMHEFADQAELEATLTDLVGRGLAVELPRRPGQSATRWTTTWGRGEVLVEAPPAMAPVVPSAAVPGAVAAGGDELAHEVEALRAEVAELRSSLDEVRRALGL